MSRESIRTAIAILGVLLAAFAGYQVLMQIAISNVTAFSQMSSECPRSHDGLEYLESLCEARQIATQISATNVLRKTDDFGFTRVNYYALREVKNHLEDELLHHLIEGADWVLAHRDRFSEDQRCRIEADFIGHFLIDKPQDGKLLDAWAHYKERHARTPGERAKLYDHERFRRMSKKVEAIAGSCVVPREDRKARSRE